MKRAAALAGALALSLLPRVAAACPSCAGREEGATAKIAALGLFILFPFVIALVVARVLKKFDQEEEMDS